MFSFTEYQGQSSLDKHGTLELNTSYVAPQKPLWLVLVKLAVLAGMLAVGAVIVMPILMNWLPPWKAAAATAGVVLLYIGIAFLVRPRYNSDNMGWFGGLANDPFQYSDNINRFLFQLHMVLGPGRFAAETLLDAWARLGASTVPETVQPPEQPGISYDPSIYSQAAGGPTEPLSPPPVNAWEPAAAMRANRFEPARREMPAADWMQSASGPPH